MNVEVAIEEAVKELGYGVRVGADELPAADVADQWLDSRNITDRTRNEQYRVAVRAWLDYLGSRKITLHKDVRRQHFEGFIRKVNQSEQWNGWTQYHYLSKVKMMIRWASLAWEEFRDIADGIQIQKPRKVDLGDSDAWSVGMVLDFLDWLGRHPEGWKIRPAVALCGLSGLSVLEALRLPWNRVSMDSHIDITGTVKNAHRARRIPLPSEVWEVLRTSPRDGSRVVSEYTGKDDYRKDWYRFLDEWMTLAMLPKSKSVCQNSDKVFGHPNGLEKPVNQFTGFRIPPMNLRKVIMTAGELGNWAGFLLSRYCGHAPENIRQKHYTVVSGATLFERMNTEVVGRIEALCQEHREKVIRIL